MIFAAVYVVLAFRRVYGQVRFGFARIAIVLTAYLVAVVLALITIVFPVIFNRLYIRPS